jgi:hypothetical protein
MRQVFDSITTHTNTHPIGTLIWIASSLVDRCSYCPLSQTDIYGIVNLYSVCNCNAFFITILILTPSCRTVYLSKATEPEPEKFSRGNQ